MKQFDFNNYLKNNLLLKEDLESDIRKDLEKVSGMKLQTVNTKYHDQMLKKLDSIANSLGLIKAKPDKSNKDIAYIAKWKPKSSGEGVDEVDLYYFLDEPDTLRLAFMSGMSRHHELAKDCLSKDKWYKAFDKIGDY